MEINTTPKKTKKLGPIIIVFAVIMLVMGTIGIGWIIDMNMFVSTDDARIASNNVKAASKISGKVVSILVVEGDQVSQNQVLAILDKTDLTIALKQAQANYHMAEVKYAQAKEGLALQKVNNSTGLKQANAGLEISKEKLTATEGGRPEETAIAKGKADSALISLNMAKEDTNKAVKLYAIGAISKHDLDKAKNSESIAEKSYQLARESYDLVKNGPRAEDKDIAKQQVEQSKAILEQSNSGTGIIKIKEMEIKAAGIAKEQAQAALDLAQYNYDNTIIKAQIAGTVAQKTINPGEYVAPGQTMFTLINPGNIWIQANIKETSISDVKTGSPVTIYLDQFPGKKFTGKVSEIGVATNANFSILPLGNSAGNFVKVVQNIPIKIVFDEYNKDLRIGSSAKIKIKTVK